MIETWTCILSLLNKIDWMKLIDYNYCFDTLTRASLSWQLSDGLFWISRSPCSVERVQSTSWMSSNRTDLFFSHFNLLTDLFPRSTGIMACSTGLTIQENRNIQSTSIYHRQILRSDIEFYSPRNDPDPKLIPRSSDYNKQNQCLIFNTIATYLFK